MKASSIFAVAIATLTLGGCVVAIGGDRDGHSTTYTSGDYNSYGSIYAASVRPDAIAFTVESNGCTDESFFHVDVVKTDTDAFNVGLTRTRQDYCKAHVPDGKTVNWTYRELGIPAGAQVSVLNGIRR